MVTVTGYTGVYDAVAHGATGTVVGVSGDLSAAGSSLNLGASFINVPGGTANWAFTGGTNYNDQIGRAAIVISARAALVNYIGQTQWVTSGTSATTAQVTLTASMQDPTGTALAGATVNFIWLDGTTRKVLASGVKVSSVAGSTANTGTANTVVTLSTGQFGAESYIILVELTGNYNNSAQDIADKTATVVLSKPAAINETIGAGTISRSGKAVAGTFGVASHASTGVSYTVGLKYTKSGANLQGRVTLIIPQANGGFVIIRSTAISSMLVSPFTGGKKSTIYAKASVSLIDNLGNVTSGEGNVTLRMDVVDYNQPILPIPPIPNEVGFTVLSTKDSTMYYSNDWVLDTTTNTWKTKTQQISTGTVRIN